MRIYKLLLIAGLFFTFMPSSEIFADELLGKEGVIVMSKKVPGTTGDQFDLFWTDLGQGNGEVWQITDTPGCNEIQPSISPNGNFVAFSSDCNGVGTYWDGFYRIYIHNITKPQSMSKNPQFLTSSDTMKSGAGLKSKFNSFNPSWGSWQGNPNKDSNKQANGPILFQSDLNGDMGIYMKFAGPGWSLPAIKIMDRPGVDEIEPSIHPTGPRSAGKNFDGAYVYSWIEKGGTRNQGISIGTFEDPYRNCPPPVWDDNSSSYAGGYAEGFDREAEIQNFNFEPGCEDLSGGSWTMGIEGHSVDWYTGPKNPQEKHFPGSKGEPVFTFIRKGTLPNTTKMMWATTPNREVFGQKEMIVGEFRGYTRFGGEFAELRQPRFSPYGESAFGIAHFMRDTNPLKNDQGSLKVLEPPDNIKRIDLKTISRDFDWGRSFIGYSGDNPDNNFSSEQNDKSNELQKEAEKLESELRLLVEKANEKKAEEKRLQEEEMRLQEKMLEELSREEQLELDREIQRLEEERRRLEQEAELDLERQKMDLEMRRQELEMEQQREQMQIMMEELESRGNAYEEEQCYVESEEGARGLFGNLEIGAQIDCTIGDDFEERLKDPTTLAMLGLMVTVGATVLQMIRGN